MTNLAQRQKKFQQRMMDISFDQFIDTYASWCPLMLYKRDGMITQYPDTPRSPVIASPDEFHPNREGFVSYGIEYDEQIDFFVQRESLRKQVPMATLFSYGSRENSDYANCIINAKNSYLSMVVVESEDVCYSISIKDGCINVFNSVMVRDNCQNVYQSIGIIKSYNIFYSKYCHNCSDIRFCTNCIGCAHCLFCNDMENASYCIQNIEYSPEEYQQKKQALLKKNKHKFYQTYTSLSAKSKNIVSDNVSGQLLIECSDVQNGYYSYKVQNSHNTFLVGGKEGNQHIANMFVGGAPSSDHMYGSVLGGMYSEHVYASTMFDNCNNMWYSIMMADCSYCFGCVGLKNKQFCILNKQYKKDERFTIVDKILHDLDEQGDIGSFFPAKMNPFYLNDTMAAVIKNYEANYCTDHGYMWREDSIKADIPAGAEVVKVSELSNYEGRTNTSSGPSSEAKGKDLSDNKDSSSQSSSEGQKWHIDPSILKKIIVDDQGNYYRVVQMEYDFLVKNKLPLPRKHRMDRMKENFRLQ